MARDVVIHLGNTKILCPRRRCKYFGCCVRKTIRGATCCDTATSVIPKGDILPLLCSFKALISTFCSVSEAVISLSTAWMSCGQGGWSGVSVWSAETEQTRSNGRKNVMLSILSLDNCCAAVQLQSEAFYNIDEEVTAPPLKHTPTLPPTHPV